ncbi:MAG: hypothetical protein AAF217_00860 [Pseudomonadota bacterium]
MSGIAPVGAVGAEPAKALQQTAQTSVKETMPTVSYSMEATGPSLEIPSQSSSSASSSGFTDSVLDSVYVEIDKLSSKVPTNKASDTAVDAYKKDMAAKADSITPIKETGLDTEKADAVTALSKTFDHAIFMAMVNQVVSGVGDTSRTLIRQA